jgi:RNA polymerase sigma-70 factor, ECF subfamily
MSGSQEGSKGVDPTLGPAIRDHIGERLGALFAPVVEGTPAALLDLVAKLTQVLSARDDAATKDFRDGLLTALPHLRAFAISLSGSPHRADDLVQETMLKALRNSDKFEAGSNLQGWLFTILRNQFHTEYRKWHREVADPDGIFAGKLGVMPEQEAKVGHEDLLAALAKVPAEQREALILVGAQGITYEEAAEICRVPIGTIKSRVNRGRARLAALLSVEDGDYAGNGVSLAAIGMNGAG